MSSMTGFIKEFRGFLRSADDGTWESDITIREFRRWMLESLMPFSEISANEQFREKINYENSIGNEGKAFLKITDFMENWVELNEEKPSDYIWYHGTIEKKLAKIIFKGAIERSTPETAQHEGFEGDIGSVSLTRNERSARFFALVGKSGKPVVLSIDIRKLNPDKIEYRLLFDDPKGEMLYYDDIPLEAIIPD